MRKSVVFTVVTAIVCLFGSIFFPRSHRQPEIKWDNPHGRGSNGVSHGSFHSAVIEADVGYNVFLPPGYGDTEVRYPVMYFLHGGGGNENTGAGAFSGIVSSLIVMKKIPPVICVFPNGGMTGHRDRPRKKMMGETLLIKEILPLIDQRYRTNATRDARVIAGFSVGGVAAVHLALKHPDLFSAASSCGGPLGLNNGDNPDELQTEELRKVGDRVRLLLIMGDQDPNFPWHQAGIDRLEEAGIPVRHKTLSGVSHHLDAYLRKSGEELVFFLTQTLPTAKSFPEQSSSRP